MKCTKKEKEGVKDQGVKEVKQVMSTPWKTSDRTYFLLSPVPAKGRLTNFFLSFTLTHTPA